MESEVFFCLPFFDSKNIQKTWEVWGFHSFLYHKTILRMQNAPSRIPCRKSFHIECKTDSKKGLLKVEHNWKILYFSFLTPSVITAIRCCETKH